MKRGPAVTEATPIGLALAPAKVNLGLEVTNKRQDGYHNLASIIQTISLFDRVQLLAAGDGRVVTLGEDIDSSQNLIRRAAEMMAEVFDRTLDVDFLLHKRIPLSSGLGGGSSDAAAAIRLLASYWNIPDDDNRLPEVALSCGSDVPFFLTGGRAMVEGRGEQVRLLPPISPCWVVIIVPNIMVPLKTQSLYRALRPEDFSDGSSVSAMASSDQVPKGQLPNVFERAMSDMLPELGMLRSAAGHPDVIAHGLSGAGPAYFMVVHDGHAAATLAWDLRSAEPLRKHVIRVARTMRGPGPIVLAEEPRDGTARSRGR
jgi:4-diphosphocytidyl-2-C-methyl-D-erythritol kinase